MLARKQRMWSVGACAVSVTLLLAILHVGNGAPTFSDLLSGADLQNAELSSHLQNSVGEGGSQLADLIDSPLMLAKKKIDQYLNEDSDGPGDTASKMNVVGSKGGAPCTTLKCDQGVFTNDYITKSEQHMEKVLNGEDPFKKPLTPDHQKQFADFGNDFDIAANTQGGGNGGITGTAQAEVPLTMGALTIALTKKLDALKENFREVRAKFSNGEGKVIRINVSPTGPRGPPGIPGFIGLQGNPGPVGSFGPPGPKGPMGPMGPPGPMGPKGRPGPAGSIGESGGMGPTGGEGQMGPEGFGGPPGARGLPGAAGAPGTNGKDGPPGPPGRNSPEGDPGPPGPKGPTGITGNPGKAGVAGPQGFTGTTGKSGGIGQQGGTGTAGKDGVGPPKVVPAKTEGEWPKGNCYKTTDSCSNFGVKTNLCGQCEPLCKKCGMREGFILKNSNGLRFKGFTFDDNKLKPGDNQVRNICMLARYGNEGTWTDNTKDIISAKSFGESSPDSEQPHWFGNCDPDPKDLSMLECCSNSMLIGPEHNWFKYGSGNSCAGDLDKDRVTTMITCIFDEKSYTEKSTPPVPRDHDNIGGGLISDGDEIDLTNYRSLDGRWEFVLGNNGKMFIMNRHTQETIWMVNMQVGGAAVSPYRLVMQASGNLVVYNGQKSAVWSSKTEGTGATRVTLTNRGFLMVLAPGPFGGLQLIKKQTNKDDMGDSTFFLDRHNVQCDKDPLQGFQLKVASGKVGYDYTCAKGGQFNAPQEMTTEMKDDGGNFWYLQQIDVDCGPHRAISQFNLYRHILVHEHTHIHTAYNAATRVTTVTTTVTKTTHTKHAYGFQCVTSAGDNSLTVREVETAWDDAKGSPPDTLSDQQAQCYLNRYTDLQSAFGATNIAAAKTHWVQFGKKEKRDWSCPNLANLAWLEKHPVTCSDNEVMQQFRLEYDDAKTRIRYKFRCAKVMMVNKCEWSSGGCPVVNRMNPDMVEKVTRPPCDCSKQAKCTEVKPDAQKWPDTSNMMCGKRKAGDVEVECVCNLGGYTAGEWPLGWCQPLDDECKKLGVKANLCGKCEALPGGGFKLSETKAGLRFEGNSFDDNQNGKGTYQAMNICILAKYGNGGQVQFRPTPECAGTTLQGLKKQPHWYANCQKGDKNEKECCANAAVLESGFEWTKFARGNHCPGDEDTDAPLGDVSCFFETTPKAAAAPSPPASPAAPPPAPATTTGLDNAPPPKDAGLMDAGGKDCVQSLELAGAATGGCRFMDGNNGSPNKGFCYAWDSAQKWCAKNLKSIYCSDGGAEWSTPPVGNAADQWSTAWTPHTNIPVYDKGVATAETYTCQCMKGCTCTSEGATQKCFCAVADQKPVGVGKEWSISKIIRNQGKAKECACLCGGFGL